MNRTNQFCTTCKRTTDSGCENCNYFVPEIEVETVDHEDDWYNETHEDALFWDDFDGGIFLDDEKEGDES